MTDRKSSRQAAITRQECCESMRADLGSLTCYALTPPARQKTGVLDEGSSFVAMSMAIDERSGRLYIGAADSVVRVWDLRRGTELGVARGTGLNTSIALAGNGSVMLTGSSSPDVKALLWKLDRKGTAPPELLHRLGVHDETVTALAISKDGKIAFTGDRQGIGVLWNTSTGRPIGGRINIGQSARINDAAFSPDGKTVWLGSDDRVLVEMDVATRSISRTLPHNGLVTSLSLSTDGSQIVAVSESTLGDRIETAATLWDLKSEQRQVLAEANFYRESDSSKRDNRRIVSASFRPRYGDRESDNDPGIGTASIGPVVIGVRTDDSGGSELQQWDTSEGLGGAVRLQTLRLPLTVAPITAALPLRSGELVSLCGDAGFLWDAGTLQHQRSYRAHGAVTQAVFTHDADFIITASRSLKVWDAAVGGAVAKVEVPHGERLERWPQYVETGWI